MQSASGGTDVVTAFAVGSPILPVRPGELSGPSLGIALAAWDPAGRPVLGQTGESGSDPSAGPISRPA
ncbi:hypothetical protein H1V43_22440 [Streptomyces sp. PSKA54]|uniref:Uncharacterized protein n=1 Tax=Streptomyces himalayensis subsp. aureolus TaxID=2758039 RepID=A0A7W2D3F8_9ACTN|nr:hypothetical protein [Streptomyces himalayensis]MBA4864064.1 hypothetical protein [Streptomyces himalayensis subsp. aureolus]